MNFIVQDETDGLPHISKTERAVDNANRIYGEFGAAKMAAIIECASEIEHLRAHLAKLRKLREKNALVEFKETYTPGTP